MDDQSFDDRIRKKVGEFEASAFDPAALAALHHQMAAAQSSSPWYSRFRSELLTGAAISLCTLIILLHHSYLHNAQVQHWLKEEEINIAQQKQIDLLEHKLRELSMQQPDTVTVFVRDEDAKIIYQSLIDKIASLQSMIATNAVQRSSYSGEDYGNRSTLSGNNNDVAPGHNALIASLSWKEDVQPKSEHPPQSSLSSRELKAKDLRNLERHYFNGMGIRVSPVAEYSKAFYSTGAGNINLGGGILVDLILSPAISLEAGGKFAHRDYEIESPVTNQISLPGIDAEYGELKLAEIDSWMIEIPFNIKYRYPLSLKTHWISSLGYSALIYTKQSFEYSYEYVDNPDLIVSSFYQEDRAHLYPGTANLYLGIAREMKKRKLIEAGIFYQHGLGSAGRESIKPNFLGVRAAYWFKIK